MDAFPKPEQRNVNTNNATLWIHSRLDMTNNNNNHNNNTFHPVRLYGQNYLLHKTAWMMVALSKRVVFIRLNNQFSVFITLLYSVKSLSAVVANTVVDMLLTYYFINVLLLRRSDVCVFECFVFCCLSFFFFQWNQFFGYRQHLWFKQRSSNKNMRFC